MLKLFKPKSTSGYFLFLALAAALAAGFLGMKTVEKFTTALPVVVAKAEIAPYTPITQEMLTVENLPQAAIQKGMYPDPQGVIGKVAKTIIPQGVAVSQAFLAVEGPGSLLTSQVSEFKDPKLRATELKCGEVLGGKVVPGDRVDVIGSMKLPIGGLQQPVSQIIGIQVPILAVTGDPAKPTGVIVGLTPQQAQDAAFAETAGTIKLALNPYQPDVNAAKTMPTTSDSFVSKYILQNQPVVQETQDTNDKPKKSSKRG